jgi:hypothetical protein
MDHFAPYAFHGGGVADVLLRFTVLRRVPLRRRGSVRQEQTPEKATQRFGGLFEGLGGE